MDSGEYYVVLTNTVDEKDIINSIRREKVLDQRFTIVDGTIKSKIWNVQPNRGPDSGSTTEISGQFFGTLNIPEFIPEGDGLPEIITNPDTKNPRTLTVEYGRGEPMEMRETLHI